MFDWVSDTPLTYLEEEKNCEKPVKEFFFRNAAAKTKKQFLRNFWEKLYWEMIFFTVVFSKFWKNRNLEVAIKSAL